MIIPNKIERILRVVFNMNKVKLNEKLRKIILLNLRLLLIYMNHHFHNNLDYNMKMQN